MIVLAIDIGGKTRNGFAVMDSDNYKLLDYSYITYDNKRTPLDHRYKINNEISNYIQSIDNIDIMVFEKINLFRGGNISLLNNILSLCRVQTTITDQFSDKLDIYAVPVQSWKSRSLKSAKADKEASLRAVSLEYPDINLDIEIYHPRKKEVEIVKNHDLADAIMIAKAICMDPKLIQDKYHMNYK